MRPCVSIFIFAMAMAWASLVQADPRAMMMGAAWMQQRQARQSAVIQPPKAGLVPRPAPKSKPVKPAAAAKKAKPTKPATAATATAHTTAATPKAHTKAPPSATVKVAKKNAKPQSTADAALSYDVAAPAAPAAPTVDPPAAIPVRAPSALRDEAAGIPPEREHPGILSRLMRRLGRMVGAGLRKKNAAVAKVKQAAASLTGSRSNRPGIEPHRIPYGSLPVGILLSRLRLGTLHQLNPNTLVQLRQSRVITEVEYQVLLRQLMGR
jgi:outer membrane biosynthesis protein TonB